MPRVSRTDRFIRILVVTTMFWGFALPIVHLVCGMTAAGMEVMCDDHGPMDDGHDTAGHDAPSSTEARAGVHESSPHEMHGMHAAATHETQASVMPQTHTSKPALGPDDARNLHNRTAEFAARDDRVECCWVDANALDGRAVLPWITQLTDLTVMETGAAPAVDGPEAYAIDRTAEATPSPPIAFRLLFSVFLI